MADRDIYDKNKHPEDRKRKPKRIPSDPTGQHLKDRTNYYQPPLDTPGRAPSGNLSLFDPDNPDRNLIDEVEIEINALSAPPSKLYRLDFDRTDIDDLHGEAQTRYYRPPIVVYGDYEDVSFESTLTRFGIDERQEIDMTFNYTYLLRDCGGQINEGDLIQTYDGRLWEVMGSVVQDEPLWRYQHDYLHLKRVAGEGYRIPDPDNSGEWLDLSDSPNLGSKTGRNPKSEDEPRKEEQREVEVKQKVASNRIDDY